MSSNIQLNDDTKIFLDCNDILEIFAPTKKITDVIVKQITGFDEEIQVVLDLKLKNA